MNLDRFVALPQASQGGGDVFAMEFRNGWEARDAREAAELSAVHDRPRSGHRALQRGLIAVGRVGGATAGRLDDVLADKLRRAHPIGR